MKFGWCAAGFLMGPVAILLAWLVNLSNFPKAKSDAMKFALIGFLIELAVLFVVVMFFGAAIAVAMTQSRYSTYGSYYGYY